MDYTLLHEIIAEERVRDLTRVDTHRAEALELVPASKGLRGVAASLFLRLATALDGNVVRPATAR